MPYYKTLPNTLHFLESIEFEYLLPTGAVRITDDEAADLLPKPEPEDLAKTYIAYIQRRLDTFAQTRGYDNALSCCTYVTSTVAKFRTEGSYMVEARDLTWSAGYQILADVQAGLRPIPTFEELDSELPALQWPDSV